MSQQLDLSIYRERILAMQESCLSGSVALGHPYPGDDTPPVWLNSITIQSVNVEASGLLTWTMRNRILLFYGYVDEGYKQGRDRHVQAQDDQTTVLRYFYENNQFVLSPTYTTEPAGYRPDSFRISVDPEGVREWRALHDQYIGTEYIMTWLHREPKTNT